MPTLIYKITLTAVSLVSLIRNLIMKLIIFETIPHFNFPVNRVEKNILHRKIQTQLIHYYHGHGGYYSY